MGRLLLHIFAERAATIHGVKAPMVGRTPHGAHTTSSRSWPRPESNSARSAGVSCGDARKVGNENHFIPSTESEEIMSELYQDFEKNIAARGNGRSILVAALVGAGVGAGIALLFAPCSGKDTRGWLADRSRQIKDKTASVVEQGKDATRRAAREIGRVAQEAGKAVDRAVPNGTVVGNLHK
jgi:gas vesicle protein